MSSPYIETRLWDEFRHDLQSVGLTIHADAEALVREVIFGMAQHIQRGSELAMSEARTKLLRLAQRMKEWAEANNTTEVTSAGFLHSKPLTGRFRPLPDPGNG